MIVPIQKSLKLAQMSVPGVLIIGGVAIARAFGLLEPLELSAFDYLFRLRPTESVDERIIVLKIDEEDISDLGGYPLSSTHVLNLIEDIQSLKPRVIGLNLLPDLVQDNDLKKGRNRIESDNIVVAEKILPPQIGDIFNLPDQFRVGFSDVYLDGDLKSRRALLGTPNPINPERDYRFSLSIQLAELYLVKETDPSGELYTLRNGDSDEGAMQFGDVELPRVTSHTGGYVGVDDGGVQMIVNYRNAHGSKYPFQTLTLREFREKEFEPSDFTDRIVIIGVSDPRVRPPFLTQAVNYSSSGKIDAIDFQAHTTSQIISSVLDARGLIITSPRLLEFAWIVAWGTLLTYSWRRGKVYKTYLRKSLSITALFLGISYFLFVQEIWIPLVPVLIIAVVNILIYVFHAKKNQILRQRLQERQSIIENTFDIIHNGPLQELSSLLRFIKGHQLFKQNPDTAAKLIEDLGDLDYGIRAIGENLKNEALAEENSVHLLGGDTLDLNQEIHELFYHVFSATLNRNIPEFQNIRIKVRKFEPIGGTFLDFEDKRLLCLFLEEALCNVAKHTKVIDQIKAVGQKNNHQYVLYIEDRGIKSEQQHRIGNGSKQAQKLANRLSGTFSRESLSPKSMRCQMAWPLRRKFSMRLVLALVSDYFENTLNSRKTGFHPKEYRK